MSGSSIAILILFLVAAQRLTELVIDRKHTAALLVQGAVEHGAKHYPLFILLHGSWLVVLFGWALAMPIEIQWLWLIPFVVLQALRVWILGTLGAYWTTRIISIAERPLVTSGPYRFVRHPNYWVVIGEIAVLPLVIGAWPVAFVYSILNGFLLRHRIKVENAALQPRR